MEYFDTGLFMILSSLAFGLMILSFKYVDASAGMIFFLFSSMVFFTLALILVSEIPIQSVTSMTDGSTTWTETDTLIGIENGYILGLFFMVFGILNVGLLFYKMMPQGARE